MTAKENTGTEGQKQSRLAQFHLDSLCTFTAGIVSLTYPAPFGLHVRRGGGDNKKKIKSMTKTNK